MFAFESRAIASDLGSAFLEIIASSTSTHMFTFLLVERLKDMPNAPLQNIFAEPMLSRRKFKTALKLGLLGLLYNSESADSLVIFQSLRYFQTCIAIH